MNKELVIDYCINELHTKPDEAERLFKKIFKHSEIYKEFLNWLQTRDYNSIANPLIINGYSAAAIHELAPTLTGIGVYNFLVTLTESPELAQEIIDSRFVIL